SACKRFGTTKPSGVRRCSRHPVGPSRRLRLHSSSTLARSGELSRTRSPHRRDPEGVVVLCQGRLATCGIAYQGQPAVSIGASTPRSCWIVSSPEIPHDRTRKREMKEAVAVAEGRFGEPKNPLWQHRVAVSKGSLANANSEWSSARPPREAR